jgi:hypothetical protein
MSRRYHRDKSRQSFAAFVSFLTVQTIALAAVWPAPSSGAGLKDCVAMTAGRGATVHEGRYNILCVIPPPGPVTLQCSADGVAADSLLQVFAHDIAGAGDSTLTLTGDGPLPAISGTAGRDAHVFFSYAGPFDPIRDGYRLTCRW